MRVLLDACVPKGMRKSLLGHELRTAPEMGWGDLDNGDLLDAMGGLFDALVTVDKRLPQQQHINDRSFGVIVLRATWSPVGEVVAARDMPAARPFAADDSKGSARG